MRTTGKDYPLPLRSLIVGRVLMSTSATLFPHAALRMFRVAPSGVDAAAFRMFGIRNAFLAFYLIKIRRIEDVPGLLLLNVIADTVDAAAIVDSYRRKEASAATLMLGGAAAGFAAVMGGLSYQTFRRAASKELQLPI